MFLVTPCVSAGLFSVSNGQTEKHFWFWQCFLPLQKCLNHSKSNFFWSGSVFTCAQVVFQCDEMISINLSVQRLQQEACSEPQQPAGWLAAVQPCYWQNDRNKKKKKKRKLTVTCWEHASAAFTFDFHLYLLLWWGEKNVNPYFFWLIFIFVNWKRNYFAEQRREEVMMSMRFGRREKKNRGQSPL